MSEKKSPKKFFTTGVEVGRQELTLKRRKIRRLADQCRKVERGDARTQIDAASTADYNFFRVTVGMK